MQIGNPELDSVWAEVFEPSLRACGLDPRRVDKHNRGELLKSEIIRFIEEAEIIVADLTNERPNCYLEVGYAMGIDKFTNLILTAKEDHRLDSPHHQRGGPKIHFDLAGYEILFWEADKLEDFRQELEKRIRRRKAILVPAGVQKPVWDTGWLAKHREKALAGLAELDFKAHMETRFALLGENLSKSPSELVGAAEQAQIHASGWPFAVVLTKAAYAPRPTAEGIIAEIRIPGEPSYDYWALRRSGDFFLLRSLSEDRQQPENIWFDTRITQVTEALLYCSRLYSRLGVPPDGRLAVAIKHSGLQGR